MAGKEAVVVIIDVGASMGKSLDGKPKLSTAIEATKLLIQQKLLLTKSHEVGIVLLGSEETDNNLAESYGGYENISILQELDVPTSDSMLLVSSLEPSRVSADILDSIVVAITLIDTKIGKKKYKKRLFILTDGNCLIKSPDQLQDIIDQINIIDIKVNIIAIGFGEENQEHTKQQMIVHELLTVLISSVQGAIYPSSTAMQIYKQFRKRSVYPVAKYKGQLDLGLGYGIDVLVYAKTKEEPLPSLKKHSTVVDYTSNAKEGLVKMSRESALEDDPNSTVIDPENIIKAYYYGKSVVPVSNVDEDLLKYPCRKCMKVLGYISAASVPRHYFMAGVDIVLPSTDQSQEIAFAALVQALYQRDDVILIRYSYRDNSTVKLAVLAPCIKPEIICLWLNYLPTNEDIRNYPFPDLAASTQDQNTITENFINSLSLDKTAESDEKLKPSSLFSPTLQYFYQCITFRSENSDAPLPPLDPKIENYLRPDKEMFDEAKQQCNEFVNAFNIREVEVVQKEKTFYVDLIKGKPGDDQDLDETVNKISDLNPIGDFYKMINDRKVDRVVLALQQMQDHILKLLDRDFRGNMNAKAIECLKALRAGCLQQHETESFNNFLAVKIKNLQNIHLEFWNLIVHENIGLITSSESPDSRVNDNEAKNFLVRADASQPRNSGMDLEDIE